MNRPALPRVFEERAGAGGATAPGGERVTTMRAMRTAVVGVALIALAGCGGGDDGAETPGGTETTVEEDTATPTEEPAEEPTDEGDAAAAGDVSLELGTTSLGEVLVDGEGMTLYMFDKDTDGKSACYDDCATAWPPLLAEGEPTVGEGLDESMVSTVARDDGTMQVVYGDWPLYYWQDDAAPGDVTGQAVGEVWWVVGADGQPIKTPAATS